MALNQTTQNTIRAENEGQLKMRQEKLNLAKKEFEAVNKELTDLKTELGVEDFKSKRDEIIKQDKMKADLEGELKKLREELKNAQDRKELLNTEAANLREALEGHKAN